MHPQPGTRTVQQPTHTLPHIQVTVCVSWEGPASPNPRTNLESSAAVPQKRENFGVPRFAWRPYQGTRELQRTSLPFPLFALPLCCLLPVACLPPSPPSLSLCPWTPSTGTLVTLKQAPPPQATTVKLEHKSSEPDQTLEPWLSSCLLRWACGHWSSSESQAWAFIRKHSQPW